MRIATWTRKENTFQKRSGSSESFVLRARRNLFFTHSRVTSSTDGRLKTCGKIYKIYGKIYKRRFISPAWATGLFFIAIFLTGDSEVGQAKHRKTRWVFSRGSPKLRGKFRGRKRTKVLFSVVVNERFSKKLILFGLQLPSIIWVCWRQSLPSIEPSCLNRPKPRKKARALMY